MRKYLLVLLTGLLLAAGTIHQVRAELAGPARVIDGDTIDLAGVRVRLHAIDAPERNQLCRDREARIYRCGAVAVEALISLVQGLVVHCEPTGLKHWNRVIARCFADGKDLGEALVQEGHALAARRYGQDYVAAEETARRACLNLWSGSFMPPDEWRRIRGRGAPQSRVGL